MELFHDIFGVFVRPVAKAVKIILPASLKARFEPDSNVGDFVGFGLLIILFCTVITATTLYISSAGSKQFKIDSCLDSGGKYNYQEDLCELTSKLSSSRAQ